MDIFEKEKNEGLEFVKILYKNIRVIIIFVLVTALLVMIFTFMTPKKYRSYAIVFPTESNSIDDVIHNPQFGYDIEADRLIQILQSRGIMDSIIKKYDLINYYKINIKRPDWYDRLRKKYYKDIYFSKTSNMSVYIYARTKKPEMSAAIVNSIISLINATRERILKQNVYIAGDALQSEYYSLKNDLDSLNSVVGSMTKNRDDFKQFIQTERYISLVFNKDQLSNDESVRALQQVVIQYNIKLGWFYDVQNKLKSTMLMRKRPLPSVYVIENAIPSYKKIYPSYSRNLMVSFAGSFIFISFFLFLLSKLRYLRSQMQV